MATFVVTVDGEDFTLVSTDNHGVYSFAALDSRDNIVASGIHVEYRKAREIVLANLRKHVQMAAY